MNIGPTNEEEARVFAEEALVVDVQVAIHRAMVKRDISRAELAERLGVEPSQVTRFFGSSANPTIRMVARVLHALGLDPVLLILKE